MLEEDVSQERVVRLMDSYVASLRNGYLGVGSGRVTPPPEMELHTEEEIDIVKPQTFDPAHPGLGNLSPNQLS